MQYYRIGYFRTGTRTALLALGTLLVSTGLLLTPEPSRQPPIAAVALPELVIVLEGTR